jgi:hypothetical protein
VVIGRRSVLWFAVEYRGGVRVEKGARIFYYGRGGSK